MVKVLTTAYGEQAYTPMNLRIATEEAIRCLLCHDAPCSAHCPAGTDPGKFIRSLRFGNIYGAAETIRENNPLGGSCALVCPYDNLCEQACSRTGIDRPIQIGRLQQFLVGEERRLDMHLVSAKSANGKTIACVGAGPASLACAAVLARQGCAVTIFEAKDRAGGVLTYGISPSRLPQDVVEYDVRLVESLGVRLTCNVTLQPDDIAALAHEYDAVFVGLGLWRAKKFDVPGNSLKGVVSAIDYLEKARTTRAREDATHVLVIGGGDVAMDCASTARQCGADKVAVVYRRTLAEAPCNNEELAFVQALGIPVMTDFAPAEVLGQDGVVCGMRFAGRDGYSELRLKADKVLVAIGQEQVPAFATLPSAPNIFCGGDCANGGATVVRAVAEGKKAAGEITHLLARTSGNSAGRHE